MNFRTRSLVVICVLAPFALSLLHAQGTLQDYQRAQQFLPGNLRHIVYLADVNPHWIEKTSRFWYRKSSPVDAEHNTSSPAFDHARLAEALSHASKWVGSGKPIQIQSAPTRWGRVSFSLLTKNETKSVVANVELTGATLRKEVHFKLRLPSRMALQKVTVNGKSAALGGLHRDTVMIATENKKQFEIIGQMA